MSSHWQRPNMIKCFLKIWSILKMKDSRWYLFYILFEAQQVSSADGKGQILQFPVHVNPMNNLTLLKFFSFLRATVTGSNNKAILLLYNEITLAPLHRINDTYSLPGDNAKLCLDGTESTSWPPGPKEDGNKIQQYKSNVSMKKNPDLTYRFHQVLLIFWFLPVSSNSSAWPTCKYGSFFCTQNGKW